MAAHPYIMGQGVGSIPALLPGVPNLGSLAIDSLAIDRLDPEGGGWELSS